MARTTGFQTGDPLLLTRCAPLTNRKRFRPRYHLRIGAAAVLDAMVREAKIGEMDGHRRARQILLKAFDDLLGSEEGEEVVK